MWKFWNEKGVWKWKNKNKKANGKIFHQFLPIVNMVQVKLTDMKQISIEERDLMNVKFRKKKKQKNKQQSYWIINYKKVFRDLHLLN